MNYNSTNTFYSISTISDVVSDLVETFNTSGTYYKSPSWFTSFELPSSYNVEYCSYPVTNHSIDEKGNQTLEIAVTGFDKSELKVEIKQNKLIVSGKKEKSEKEENKKYLHKKIGSRDFDVTWILNEKVDVEKIETKYERGMLIIDLPIKAEITKNDRELKIK